MKVGQEVVIYRIGNAARNRSREDLIETSTITKVARKYFYIEGYSQSKFGIDEMRDISDYSSNYEVYFSREILDDKLELAELKNKIRDFFSYTPLLSEKALPIDTARKIWDMLKEITNE